MKKFKLLLSLFLTMFKIGLFTFGGGYAMIAVIEREVVERKKWIEHKEYLDVIAIAESTPGPLAVNSATYIGHKTGGFWGAVFATLGVVLPSFIIILIISLFFDKFLQLKFVGYAFKGIQAAVAFLILSAGVKMLKQLKLNAFNATLFCLSAAALLLLTLFAANFSSVYLILIGGVLGVTFFGVKGRLKNKKKEDEKDKEKGIETEEKQK